jgi:hypothetical protein
MGWIAAQKSKLEVEGFASLGELQDKLTEVEKKFEEREVGRQKLGVLEELNQLLIDAHITDLSSYTEYTMQVPLLLLSSLKCLPTNQILIVEYEAFEEDVKKKIELLEGKVRNSYGI